MYLSRNAEQDIRDLVDYFPVTVIVGPRQIGKTSLAKYLSGQLARPSIYLDLEMPEDRNLLNEPTLFLEQYRNHSVILDEVQRVPALFPVLRGLVDRQRDPGRFILLGSASPELIRDTSESLAGRVAYYELTPFLLSELTPHEIDYRTHWLRGGFPEALLAPDDRRSEQWRQNFIQTYLERDLPLLGLSADPALIGRLWSMIAHYHGGLLNMETLANALDISGTSVRRYLDFMESAYLIRRLMPYYTNISKRLVKTPKIYIRDTGILHTLLNIPDFERLQRHPVLGSSWEGYVLQQIIGHLQTRDEFYFYRTADGTEADVVIVRGGTPEILFEIKHSASPSISKGFYVAQQDLKTRQHFVIHPLERNYPLNASTSAIGVSHLEEILKKR